MTPKRGKLSQKDSSASVKDTMRTDSTLARWIELSQHSTHPSQLEAPGVTCKRRSKMIPCQAQAIDAKCGSHGFMVRVVLTQKAEFILQCDKAGASMDSFQALSSAKHQNE